MTLHILTLTYNGYDKLCRLKENLLPQLASLGAHWHIKSNGCSDDTKNIKDWNNTTVHLYSDNSQNYSQGNNYLFNLINPDDQDLVLLLNNDVVINDEQSLLSMIELLKKHNAGVVGARLLYTDSGKLQHAGVVFHEGYKTPMHFRASQDPDELSSLDREFQAVTGAVLLTTAKTYRQVGGLCEELVWCFDDIDFCLSVKTKLKKKVLYCGSTNISHDESASLKKNPINKMFMNHNVRYFLTKWNGKYDIDSGMYNKYPKFKII